MSRKKSSECDLLLSIQSTNYGEKNVNDKEKIRDEKEKTPEKGVKWVCWHLPVALYSLITGEFVVIVFEKVSKKLKKENERLKNIVKFSKIGVQTFALILFAIYIITQFIVFVIDSTIFQCSKCRISMEAFQEIVFATDFINSVVSLGSCYFIYANSNIFTELAISFKPEKYECELTFLSGKNGVFSRMGIIFAYSIMLIVPSFLIVVGWVEVFEEDRLYLGSVNAYIDTFPKTINTSKCFNNTEAQIIIFDISSTFEKIGVLFSIQWHFAPVLACVVVRYICKYLQHEIEDGIEGSIKYIQEKFEEISEGKLYNEDMNRHIVKFYSLTQKVSKYGDRVYYVSTLNVILIVIIIADVFTSYTNTSADLYEKLVIRVVCIYSYQFISVWLMFDGILGVNMKLAKYSDKILSDENTIKTLESKNKTILKFVKELKEELMVIAASDERFEIAFFGDFSMSLFYTIIPIGLSVMISFFVRAIHASRFFYC